MEQSMWEHLPDVVIIEVYKYLKDEEKVNAALTCKNWGRLYYTPCLWRTRHFDVGGYRIHANALKACQFATLLGRHVHNLSINCSHPSYHTAKLFQKTMNELLFKMRHSKLIEFELERLELERFWRCESARDRLISSFVRFFRYQNRLQIFDMTAAQFSSIGGIRVLETLGSQSGDTIKEMYIEDFFHPRLAVFQVPRYINCLTLFKSVEFLALNYNCISEEVILLFAKTLAGKLDMINIKVYKNDPRFHRISGNAWRELKRACPKVIITFWFESIGFMHEIVPILVKEIPVRDFHIWTGYDDDADWRLNDTIRHLHLTYKHCIDSVSLELDNTHEMVDEEILQLVKTCKCLRDLTLNAVILVSTVREIMELQRERKIELRTLRVTACSLTELEWAQLAEIKDYYSPMIEERGLDFKFTTDLIIDFS
ncbi:F-box only protein 39-like [Saccostrea echinata]|uniref:F-box only protein 39-like n=1 Tax=Saccostrea echinata TaxID=191078 RepID=UPI002A7ED3D2|nr:F-box only protein 39-like [Saccostrea echinata]